MDGGSAALNWPVAESLSQLLSPQPDEQLGAEDVQLLADSLSSFHHEPFRQLCFRQSRCTLSTWRIDGRHVDGRTILARIDAGTSRGEPASTDRSGHDRGTVTPRASWVRIWVRIRQSC